MKILALTALLAAVASGTLDNENLENQTQWPWQVGKLYRYHVRSHNLARLPEGSNAGNAFQATFIIRVTGPGQLQARLQDPRNAEIHQELDNNRRNLPENLKFEPVKNLDVPFKIKVDGGRFEALSVPSTLSLPHQNLIKGLISSLQVDLSTYRTEHDARNNFDRESYQGQFRKMETDVTGDCDTLYTISPTYSEWRREFPEISATEDPIMITKSRNYGHCHHRVGYHFGVPEAAEWTGTANKVQKEQFIDRATNSRILAGKQGPIYIAETTNKIFVHPYVYGQQKAEVLSYVKMTLESFEQDNEPAWEEVKQTRVVQSILYSMTSKQMPIHDRSDESYVHKDVQVEKEIRERRAIKMPNKFVSVNKIVMERNRNDETEDSSSSDSTSAYVNDDGLDANEPAYAALYMNPQAHKANKDNPKNALKLVRELAQQLQDYNNMPKFDFLSKFNILVRIIAAMDYEQLTQTSKMVFESKPTSEVVKEDMYQIYRDAVAQAGTLPAFKQIVSWIQKREIVGEAAAELVGTMANTLRYPTKSTMMQFFELAMSPEVSQQLFLNSTALIAATKFINMGQVNNETAHHYYPTHMYGRLARQHDNFVYEEVLPRLRQALEQAIQQKEYSKAQVYIKALGNLGHRETLKVFAPYLEGKIVVSTYLRALMVNSLMVLAHERDSYTRSVLYSILRNPAEPYEVRVAAIQIIFASHPTTAMMLAMAQMTHDDPSIHVRAAIKSAIETAAQQENPRHLDLARTAQAARPMLTKENFGQLFSTTWFTEYFDSEYELGIMGDLSYIGSKDSMFPKYLRYSRRSQVNGWNSISASVSSVQRLVEMFKEQMNGKTPENMAQEASDLKYSAHKISEMLNIKREPQSPLEAALYVGLWKQQRYFTVQDLKGMVQEFRHLKNMHYTKVFNQAQISVMFPLSSGMPFIFRYKEPTALHIQVKFNGDITLPLPEEIKASGEIQFTYARNIDGNVGFLDTLSNRIASVGVVNKVQLTIPVTVNWEKKNNQLKMNLQALRTDCLESLIAHYSVWPYSTIQKKDTLVPISLDPATKVITRTEKVVFLDEVVKFGSFQLDGYSYSSDLKRMFQSHNLQRMIQSPKLLSDIIMAVYQRDIALTHFNIKYVETEPERNVVTFVAAYDSFYNLNENLDNTLTTVNVEDVSPISPERRTKMAKQVATGIKNARAQVVDFSVQTNSGIYLLTTAMADNPVDPKIQYAFFAGFTPKPSQELSQVNAVVKITKPNLVSINAQEALKKDLNMKFNIDIIYGKKTFENIQFDGEAKRTKEYVAELQNLVLAKTCAEQMTRNNYYQDACHKLIVLAQTPDHLDVSVSRNHVDENGRLAPTWRTNLELTIDSAHWKSIQWFSDADPTEVSKKSIYDYNIYLFLDTIMNAAWNRADKIQKGVSDHRVSSRVLSIHQLIEPYHPFCTVDGEQIKTFSHRSYSYVLSPAWHVVMQDAPKQQPWQDELVVLARRPTEQQQEVYISYQFKTGQRLEVELKPISGKPTVNVKTTTKMVSEGDYTMYLDEAEKRPFLEYYILPEGVLMLTIRENRLSVMYDGQRLVVFTKEGRNTVRGICGLMNGEIRDDYWTPQGQVDSDVHFAASYALKDGIDGKTQQLKSEAEKMAYQRVYKYTTILKSDSQWKNWHESDSNEDSTDDSNEAVYRTRTYLKQPRGTCVLSKQVQYYETSSQICITTTPLEACPSHCKGEHYKARGSQVVCRSKKDEQFRKFVNQINKGQNPQVTGVPQIRQYKVPSSCKA